MTDFSFRHLEPIFFAGLFDDPILLVRIKPTGRMLMFDCGQIHHLAKRNFTRLDAVFISHAHMDHWMGIDSVIRHLIVADRTIDIFGPAGLGDRMEHKLAGYDWNLTEDYWCSFRVHEISDQSVRSWFFAGADGFNRREAGQRSRTDRLVYQTPHCRVLAEICDHDIPSIIYRIDEKPAFLIDRKRLSELGLTPGPWLAELKKHYFSTSSEPFDRAAPIDNSQPPANADVADPNALIAKIISRQKPRSLGYVSDISYCEDNLARILLFMPDLELLICECTYLAADRHRARAADHLCSSDLSQLLQQLEPGAVLPMHLSKSYRRCPERLYRELVPPARTRVIPVPEFMTSRPLRCDEVAGILRDQPAASCEEIT